MQDEQEDPLLNAGVDRGMLEHEDYEQQNFADLRGLAAKRQGRQVLSSTEQQSLATLKAKQGVKDLV